MTAKNNLTYNKNFTSLFAPPTPLSFQNVLFLSPGWNICWARRNAFGRERGNETKNYIIQIFRWVENGTFFALLNVDNFSIAELLLVLLLLVAIPYYAVYCTLYTYFKSPSFQLYLSM